MAFGKENQPARRAESAADVPAKQNKRSRALGGVPKRVVGEAVLVAAFLSVIAFWQGDVLSGMLNMYLDDAKLWPVDGLIAALAGLYIALSDKVRPVNKIRFAAPAIVYGANSIYAARTAAGASV